VIICLPGEVILRKNFHYPCRNANGNCIGRQRTIDNGVHADPAIIADLDIANNAGTSTKNNIVSYNDHIPQGVIVWPGRDGDGVMMKENAIFPIFVRLLIMTRWHGR